MFRKKILKFLKSILKLVLPIFFKILIKLKLKRRTINFLEEKSYFSNNINDFTRVIEKIIKNEKIVALDVGAQGGFNSDNFFSSKYNIFFNDVLIEPLKIKTENSEKKIKVIKKGLWSKKEIKKLYVLGKRPGSSSMFEPDKEKFYLHNIMKKDYENYDVTETIEVECDTLENLLKEISIKEIDYLKIDTQGAELEILKGLGNYRPLLIKLEAHIFSMYKNTPSWHELLNCLYNLNYTIIDWKSIGGHRTRVPAEMDIIFIPNFNNEEGKNLILKYKEKFITLMLIFGQINILKSLLKKLNIQNEEINKLEDLYFN